MHRVEGSAVERIEIEALCVAESIMYDLIFL